MFAVMKQSPLLDFESSVFAVIAGEDEHTNPSVYGKALAQWLAEQLSAQGLPTDEVIAEDFGWCVPVDSKPYRLYVVCARAGETQEDWRVFAFVEGGLMSRLFGKDTRAQSLASLFAVVKQVLQSTPGVKGLREEEA
jgi:hypothetical protein